jgi:hypothetical protein
LKPFKAILMASQTIAASTPAICQGWPSIARIRPRRSRSRRWPAKVAVSIRPAASNTSTPTWTAWSGAAMSKA